MAFSRVFGETMESNGVRRRTKGHTMSELHLEQCEQFEFGTNDSIHLHGADKVRKHYGREEQGKLKNGRVARKSKDDGCSASLLNLILSIVKDIDDRVSQLCDSVESLKSLHCGLDDKVSRSLRHIKRISSDQKADNRSLLTQSTVNLRTRQLLPTDYLLAEHMTVQSATLNLLENMENAEMQTIKSEVENTKQTQLNDGHMHDQLTERIPNIPCQQTTSQSPDGIEFLHKMIDHQVDRGLIVLEDYDVEMDSISEQCLCSNDDTIAGNDTGTESRPIINGPEFDRKCVLEDSHPSVDLNQNMDGNVLRSEAEQIHLSVPKLDSISSSDDGYHSTECIQSKRPASKLSDVYTGGGQTDLHFNNFLKKEDNYSAPEGSHNNTSVGSCRLDIAPGGNRNGENEATAKGENCDVHRSRLCLDTDALLDVQRYLDMAELEGTPSLELILRTALQDQPSSRNRGRGLDTILCVDTSASVEGKVFEQMKSALASFVYDVKDTSMTDCLQESIGLVTFGAETKIKHHLNIEYDELLQTIDAMTAGGTSPILTALLLCLITIQQQGGPTTCFGYYIAPRIILMTDGRPTDDTRIDQLQIENLPKDPELQRKVEKLSSQLGMMGCQIFTVCTGRTSNRELLETIATVSGGTCVDFDNIRYLSQYFRYQYLAGKVINTCREIGEIQYDDVLSKEIFYRYPYYNNEVDKDNIVKLIETSQELEEKYNPGLPPPGTRIAVQLPGFNSRKSTGTIVQCRDTGWVKVLMDSCEYRLFHYKSHAAKGEIRIINSPLLADGSKLIAVGMKVQSDGGKTGTVYQTTDLGFIRVAWDDKTRSRVHYTSVEIQGFTVNEKKEQNLSDIPLAPLFKVSGVTEDHERVSTGTKFALEEWLNRTKYTSQ